MNNQISIETLKAKAFDLMRQREVITNQLVQINNEIQDAEIFERNKKLNEKQEAQEEKPQE